MSITIVLATQRSGSSLFCDDLTSLGGYGRITESFVPWLVSNGVQKRLPVAEFIDAIARSRDGRGVYGTKLMADYLPRLGRSILDEGQGEAKDPLELSLTFLSKLDVLFGDAVYYRLRRESLIDQAISRYLSLATGHVHTTQGEKMYAIAEQGRISTDKAIAQMDPYRIITLADKIERENRFLDRVVAALPRKVLDIDYDHLVSHPQEVYRDVIAHAKLPADNDRFVRSKTKVVAKKDADLIKGKMRDVLGISVEKPSDSDFSEALRSRVAYETKIGLLFSERNLFEATTKKLASQIDALNNELAMRKGARTSMTKLLRLAVSKLGSRRSPSLGQQD